MNAKCRCAECGAEATFVAEPEPHYERTCAHHDAAIVADMEATVYGEGGAK